MCVCVFDGLLIFWGDVLLFFVGLFACVVWFFVALCCRFGWFLYGFEWSSGKNRLVHLFKASQKAKNLSS